MDPAGGLVFIQIAPPVEDKSPPAKEALSVF